ncbi:autotransporter domain-containing protein [Ramlibacter pallidus]|uniref:Autotransporter domain-containing protein n=1 Tax=Ramlibacter pallidus TaxID=2780087 RepID=A0ABR9S605_9BURK|nr:autotransporter domain-containing protein [Ramlibacter pallidus]
MNHIYRSVFNHSLGAWQAVSELGRQGRGGRSRGLVRTGAVAVLAAAGAAAPGDAAAACQVSGPSFAFTYGTTVVGPASAPDNCVDWTLPITINGGELTLAAGPVQINQIGGFSGTADWSFYMASPGVTWAIVTDSPGATGTVTLRTDAHAATLQIGNGGTTGSYAGNISIATAGASVVFKRSDHVTYGQDISGTGRLVQAGSGVLTLAGDNSGFTGTTEVSNGTLALASANSIGSGTLSLQGGQLTALDTMTIAPPVTVFGAGKTSTVTAVTGQTLTLAPTDLQLEAGAVARFGSATDSGTVVLAPGTATFVDTTGRVEIAGGTLRVGNTFGSGHLGRAAGVTVGAGTTLDLDTFSTGIKDLQGSGTLVTGVGGTLALETGDFAGAITGGGRLSKAGTGVLVLSGDNSYSGTTTVLQGELRVGNGGTSGSLGAGALSNAGNVVFDRSDTHVVATDLGGAGTYAKQGTGTTILTGANTYSGTTTITAGTLQVGNGGTTGSLGSGNVTNNGALAFNRSDTVSLANVISGTGSLTQAGSGNLVLIGASTYTGGTFVNAGTLSVNGSIVGHTTVNSGGTLGGTGTVGSVAIASGGTLAPGNSIGTLNVNGNLSFAPGSVYRVEANATGAADRVNTVGAGTIHIDGGTVDVQARGGGYRRNTAYTILSSGGSTTGQFDGVTSNLAFLTPSLAYSADGVVLNLQSSAAQLYSSAARTPNQTAVANYLQGMVDTPGAAAALIQQVDNMTADQAAASFESMAGSAHASASQVASALGRNFSASLASRSGFSTSGLGNAMNDWSQVRYASLAPVETSLASPQERGLWVQALGAGGRMDPDGNAAGSRYRNGGLVLGYDQPVTGHWLAGGALGYSTSRWHATSGDAASGKIESPQAGVYARFTTDSARVRLDGTFSSHDFTTDRTVNIAGVGATANSRHKGREWGLAGQVEMPIQVGEWELRPLAGLRYAHLKEDGFNETGTSPANLAVAERTTQNTLLSAGLHFVRPFNGGKAGLELRAIASHLAGDNDSPVTAGLIGQPGSFTATGVPLRRNALTLGATVSGQFTRNVAAYLDANYEVRGSGQNAYQVTGGVRVSF